VVSRISEDAILGMPFLIHHQCALDFSRPVVRVSGKELLCTDRYGRLLLNQVQVVIPPRTEKTVTGRVTSRNYCPVGLVEAQVDGPPIATSLNQPGSKGHLVMRCMNPTNQPLRLKAGATIGTYTGVDEADVDIQTSHTVGTASNTTEGEPISANDIPLHLRELYKTASRHCTEEGQQEKLASLLVKFRRSLQHRRRGRRTHVIGRT
jgi:hypothetical protein